MQAQLARLPNPSGTWYGLNCGLWHRRVTGAVRRRGVMARVGFNLKHGD
jgi:hypothetical protein